MDLTRLSRLLWTATLLLGPRIYPYAQVFYRELRNSSSRPTVRALPVEAQRALNILFLSILTFLILSLPKFADENVFALTRARLQTENNVLFARLASMRPGEELTESDLQLKDRMQTREGRLLYLQYGHDALANCAFCSTRDPNSFMHYAVPSILAPHLAHLVVIGLTTTDTIAGPDAARWRSHAGFAGIVMAGAELYATVKYNNAANKAAARASDISFFHWNARALRFVSFALFDAILACVIYLAATRRFFVTTAPPIPEAIERTATIARALEAQNVKMTSLGALRNTIMRDPKLREKLGQYWTQERRMMGEVDQDREVVDSMSRAMEGMNMQATEAKAEEFAEMVVGSIRGV